MTDHVAKVPGRCPRLVGLGLAFLAIIHSILIALWVMPANPVRDAVDKDRLESYVLPHFGQSWSVFAPTPRKVDESLSIRARLTDPDTGKKTVTTWFDLTAEDERRTLIAFNPSRVQRASHALAGSIHTAFGKFNLAQQDLVQDGLADPADPALEKALLAPEVGPVPASKAAVRRFLRTEQMLVDFATMHARERWGAGVQQVQYRLGRRDVPAYDEPRRPDFEDVGIDLKTFGWRMASR